MNAHMSSLMDKEVTRKEFLGMSGLAVVSVFGFGSLIKLLTGKSLANHPALGRSTLSGYSTGSYGGFKDGH